MLFEGFFKLVLPLRKIRGKKGERFKKFVHKSAIKNENLGPLPLDFLATPSTPLKIIYPKTQGPPWISSYCEINESASETMPNLYTVVYCEAKNGNIFY
jgi:hypothetical protein